MTISRYGDRHWWRSRKGQLVIGTGAILGAALALWVLVPNNLFAYLVGAAIGLAPFSIETLMSVAAIGAVGIGAAEDEASAASVCIAADRARRRFHCAG